MLFKPDAKQGATEGTTKRSSRGRRFVMTLVTLAILGGLFYVGWIAWHQRPAAKAVAHQAEHWRRNELAR